MAEFSGFFDAYAVDGKYDRAYLAADFARYFAAFIGNGVYGGKANELIVRQKESANMSVRVASGQAYINGYHYENDSDEHTLTIDTADGVLDRIDLIVLRWFNDERVIRLAVKRGGAALKPVAPALQRDADFYELLLAEVYVKAGATSITQADITDRRLDKSVCGFVQGVVQQFDTTELGVQLNSFIKKFKIDSIAKMEEVIAKLNGVADNNDLASLVLDMERLEDVSENVKSDVALLEQTLGFSKKNLIVYPYAETTKSEAGITWTDNGDGTLKVDGKVQGVSRFVINPMLSLTPGRYIISSGLPATSNYFVFMEKVLKETNTGTGEVYYSHNSDTFEITEEDVEIYNFYVSAVVANDVTVSDVVFKPMIRSAEILEASWEPFKPSLEKVIQYEDKEYPGCFYKLNPVTNEKEWINPPSITNVEYKLTERWNGKPVYQRNIWLGALPNVDVMAVKVAANYDKIVSVTGYAINNNDRMYYPFPIIVGTSITPSAAIVRIEDSGLNDGWIAVRTTANMTSFIGYVDIKYVKAEEVAT